MRTTWYFINLLIWTTWYGCKAIGAGLLGVPRRPNGVYDECARRWARKLVKAANTPVKVVGWERVPRGVPVVFVSNHQSFFDILALLATIPGTVRFVAKKEMASIPVLGRAMRAAGHIYIDRQNRAAAFSAYEEAAEAIRSGLSAVVFPEGTRSRTGELLPFKKGPFVLAIAAQVPIVPVYCSGTFDILPKGRLTLRSHPITLTFEEPIMTEGLNYERRTDLLDRTREILERLRVDGAPAGR